MKELISVEQANALMVVVLFAAPIIGLVFGAVAKRAVRGLLVGTGIGIGNLILWRVYNGITDRLGLDTVKNLLVNLALFVVIGVVVGVLWARFAPAAPDDGGDVRDMVGAAVGGGPSGRDPGASRSPKNAKEPPRDGG